VANLACSSHRRFPASLRAPGESFSDVILRLAGSGERARVKTQPVA
jgi:hypothetical protein